MSSPPRGRCGRQKRGFVNIDEFRHAIERMPPAEYLNTPYYGRWLSALERGCLSRRASSPRRSWPTCRGAARSAARLPGAPGSDPVSPPSWASGPAQRPCPRPPHASPSAMPSDRNVHHGPHPLPRYARGKRGVIHGSMGARSSRTPTPTGSARTPAGLQRPLRGRELWGESAWPRDG